ncbi:hypothetical protein BK671_01320 [Pseudomonas fluorescens]|uniref:Nisin biosynthesis protein NisB n=1 Tax=Pseudomonas fluorescens TaxID=294 RepID=A0A423LW48_PSEFL|nr:hypothetical protein BK671_01320 [Pseudomonas fluorescens]
MYYPAPSTTEAQYNQPGFIPDDTVVRGIRARLDRDFKSHDFRRAAEELLDCKPAYAQQIFEEFIGAGIVVPKIEVLGRNSIVSQILSDATCTQDVDLLSLTNKIEHLAGKLESASQPVEQQVFDIYQGIQQALIGTVEQSLLANPLQVDLITRSPAIVPASSQASGWVSDIMKIAKLSHSSNEVLRNFIDRFIEKYGDTEVPLLLALNKDLGIGYGYTCYGKDDLLQDAAFIYEAEIPSAEIVLDAINQHIVQAQLRGAGCPNELLLPEHLFDVSEAGAFSQGDTLAAIGSMLPDKTAGDGKFWLRQIKGPSAITWLGRFCEADEKIAEIARLLADDEQRGLERQGIVVDVIYAATGRDANITEHSSIRQYELECFLRSGLPQAQAISLEDIVISVKQGRVVLRSVKLDKIILPRMSSAHNTRRLHHCAAYQFLGDVFTQAGSYTIPDFTSSLRVLKKLPRICFGSLLLQPASWLIDEYDRSEIKRDSQAACIESAVANLRRRHDLPVYVSVGEADQLLELDLKDALHAKILYEFIVSEKIDVVRESLAVKKLSAESSGCNHEIFLPFKTVSAPEHSQGYSFSRLPKTVGVELLRTLDKRPAPAFETSPRCSVEERSAHTDQWVYFSIGCGRGLMNLVLTRFIFPFLVSADLKGIVKKWFYIRYDDPEPHIRLRLKGDRASIRHVLSAEFSKMSDFFAGQLLIAEKSYEPEFERYGGWRGLQFAEELFSLDSVCAASFLSGELELTSDMALTEYCLSSMDSMLSALGLRVEEKYVMMNNVCGKYYSEFRVVGHKKTSLDKNYRRIFPRSAVLMKISESGCSSVLHDFLNIRNSKISRLLEPQDAEQKIGWQHFDLLECIPAYFHMCMNRMFSDNRRLKEMMIADLLRRAYESHLVKKYTKTSKGSVS